MDLNNLLEYQKIDLELYRLEKELRESDAAKSFAFFRSKRSESWDSLLRIEKETEELYKQFDRLEQSFSEQKKLVGNMESYLKELEMMHDLNEIDYYLKNIARYEETLGNIERDASKIRDRIAEIKNLYASESKLIGQYGAKLKLAMDAFDAKKAEITAKAEPIQKQLSAMKIEPETIANYYKKLRDHKKIPMVAAYLEPNCGACGMEIKNEVANKLIKSGDVAECPNCGRLVYLK